MFLSQLRLERLQEVMAYPLSELQRSQIELYVEELSLYNARFSLVKYANEQALFENHILDSLLVYSYFYSLEAEEWADVGSGAGLPGILLAIVMPFKHFTLIERSARRCQFLQIVSLRLKLTNVSILMQEVERVEEKFDAVVCRAFRSLSSFCLLLKNLLRDGGLLLAYKGKIDLGQKELEEVSPHFASAQIKILKTTSQKERCLLVLGR